MSQKTPSADSVPWLYHLEKPLKSIDKHKDFTLWLTTEAHSNFEAMLLQSSLKLTFESPPGIKQNLLRTYSAWEPSLLTFAASSASVVCAGVVPSHHPGAKDVHPARLDNVLGVFVREFAIRSCHPRRRV